LCYFVIWSGCLPTDKGISMTRLDFLFAEVFPVRACEASLVFSVQSCSPPYCFAFQLLPLVSVSARVPRSNEQADRFVFAARPSFVFVCHQNLLVSCSAGPAPFLCTSDFLHQSSCKCSILAVDFCSCYVWIITGGCQSYS
jgi:hypothetical protein